MCGRREACVVGGVHGRGHTWQRGVCGREACMAGGMCGGGVHGRGHVWWGMHGRGACVTGETATAADSIHHTGMHSCYLFFWQI